MNELIVATDFSGLGSPEEALKRLKVNHKTAFACDKDKYVKKSYLANHQPGIFYDNIVSRDQSTSPGCDLYIFGFPCQAFSMAGNRKGFEDTRGTLVHNSASYVKEKKPRAFLAENVKGLLSHDKVKGSKSKYGRTFGVIRDLFGKTVNGQQNLYKYDDCLDYHLHFFILNTKHFGIPQNRERIFLIGFRDEEDSIRFKKPKPFKLKRSLKDLLEDTVDEKFYLSEKQIQALMKNIKSEIVIDENDGVLRWQNKSKGVIYDNVSTTIKSNSINGGYRNLQYRIEPQIVAMRGRSIVDGKRKDYKGAPTEQMLEFNEENISNTITTVQKDNLLLLFEEDKIIENNPLISKKKKLNSEIPNQLNPSKESNNKQPYMQNRVFDVDGISPALTSFSDDLKFLIPDNTNKGFAEVNEYDSINLSNLNSKTRRGRVGNQIANILDTACNQGILEPGFKIRRLTPRECFRLMGFSDEFFERCASINSDTQLYKQAGNSIVVDTIMHLLIQILTALRIPFTFQ